MLRIDDPKFLEWLLRVQELSSVCFWLGFRVLMWILLMLVCMGTCVAAGLLEDPWYAMIVLSSAGMVVFMYCLDKDLRRWIALQRHFSKTASWAALRQSKRDFKCIPGGL